MANKAITNMESYFQRLSRCFLIAEIGVNHNGDLCFAKKLIDEAKKAGADAVKFQSFSASELVSECTPKVKYQIAGSKTNESSYNMLRRLELTRESEIILKNYCFSNGIEFLSTPYDLGSAEFLNEALDVNIFKTASADVIDWELHRYLAATKKPVMISVGMATLGEVEDVKRIYDRAGNSDIIFLHCVSNYPCSDEHLNLKVLDTLHRAFDVPVGLSDHSIGSVAAIAAVVFGVKVIEKHFTLSKDLDGPDHLASAVPSEFSDLVKNVRRAELMLGSAVKECQEEEVEMKLISRKSIYLRTDMKAGEIITLDNLAFRRPGNGLLANQIDAVLGRRTKQDLSKGLLLNLNNIE